MSTKLTNLLKSSRLASLLIASTIAISGCGGGSSSQSAGVGGTGITARGVVQGEVTGFGSIFVNGKKFNIDSSNFIVDGNSFFGQAGQAELALGMVVQLSVETENGVFTEKVFDVIYEDEVQGPVAGLAPFVRGETQRTFNVFGQSVIIDATGTVFKGTTFAGLVVDDIVEISGFRVSPNMIKATYVEVDPLVGNEVELRGEVDLYSGGSTFQIGSTVINIDPLNTVIDVPGGVLVNGMFVEVEGLIQGDLSVDAVEIELEDHVFGDEFDEVSLQGVISKYVSNSDFEIDGLPINAGGAQISPAGAALGNGVEVEVDGDLDGGVLIADEVELREGESRVEAQVVGGSVDTTAGSFQVYYQSLGGTVVVKTNAQTLFKDEDDSGGKIPLENFSLDDLMADNFVRVEGQEIAGDVVASIVKRIKDEDEFRLEGAVDAFAFGSWIEILGIRFDVDADITEYEDDSLTQTQFFDQLVTSGVGTLVEIKDDLPPFGVADEVEFED